jgi:hemerythrin-like metal-binding protein
MPVMRGTRGAPVLKVTQKCGCSALPKRMLNVYLKSDSYYVERRMTMPLQWSSDLEIGIFELDVQQKEFFSRFGMFSDDIENEHGHKGVTEFIGFLDRYSNEHLRYEEHLQDKSGFTGKDEHQAAHRQFVDELESFKSRLSAGEDTKELSFLMKGMLIRWIITHSKHLDKEFSDYLRVAAEKAEHEFVRKRLGEILVASDLVSEATVERALKRHRETGKKLGIILVEMGVVTKEDISNALLAQEGKTHFSKKLGNILIESGLITYATLEHALENQKITGKLLGAVLVDMGVLSVEEVIDAQAIQKGILKVATSSDIPLKAA